MSTKSHSVSPETLSLHHELFVFDCLSLFYVLTDQYAEEVLSAGVNAINVTFATEESWDQTLRRLNDGLEKINRSPYLRLALTTQEILDARTAGKVAVIPGTQGSRMLGDDLERVSILSRLGIRFLGLAYTGPTLFADGCGEYRNAGVSSYGEELIAAVDELPMMLDLSHCGHQARADGARLARAPVCTHSNAYAITPNDRNTQDNTALLIAEKGGVMGICGLPKSVSPHRATLDRLLAHCDHYKSLLGCQAVGIGLDFTQGIKDSGQPAGPASTRWRTRRPDIFGTVEEFFTVEYPDGLSRISDLPNLTQGLVDRGYSQDEIKGVMGENWLNAFRKFVG